jgi:hypothetical protein
VPPVFRSARAGGRRLVALGLLLAAGCKGSVELVEQPPDQGTGSQAGGGQAGGPSPAGAGGGRAGSSNGGLAGNASGGSVASAGAPAAAGASACASSESPGAPVPLRRLSATQVERTVAELFGTEHALSVADERILAYRSNISTSVDAASARGYFDFAGAVVADADLSRCESGCLAWLLDEIGLRLFRRPLSDAERTRYSDLYELAGDEREGAEWVLEAMLQSPSFLYFDEAVAADGTLDGYAVAARLSLLLWGRNPDLELLERAQNGELSSTAEVEAEVARLLADARSEEGIREFVDQWLDLGRIDDPDVRPDLAELGAATVNALRDEPVQFFRRLLREGAGVGELLTSTRTIAASELEELYASDIVASSAEDFELDPERRGGILALPGVVAATSHARRTSPTLRGKAVLTGLLCTPPEPPPADVDTTLPEIDEDVTTRERLEQHMTAPACKGCHAGMDGIGFALEKLDWLGRFREEENGTAVDDESTFELGGGEVTVRGAAELGQALAESPDVAECLARQWLRYAAGVVESKDADCLVAELAEDVRGSAGLERMIVKTLTSDWFRRGPGEAP